MMSKKGIWVVFEGIDGSGKSTQVMRVESELRLAGDLVRITKEPGGTTVWGKQIRSWLLNPDEGNALEPIEQFAAFCFDRTIHVNRVVRPSVNEGMIVLQDRSFGSTYAYQVYAQGVVLTYEATMITKTLLQGFYPDLWVFLDINEDLALERISMETRKRLDHFDKMGIEHLRRVREGYRRFFREQVDSDSVLVVDGSLEEAEITKLIIAAIKGE